MVSAFLSFGILNLDLTLSNFTLDALSGENKSGEVVRAELSLSDLTI
jgi:hypothetical protein